ncbi:hypothetical protein SRH_02615 [Mesomycoplasma hyorhinis MCLD]|uniref:FbpB family small basic protein n=1 Tax=Mesomycoplasma hyorhinis (strain MCLD) TaxID=936139 RepID=A0ABM5M5P7_MESHM|nr:hypothetical protein SRH_02615 [Mesomycoplasma hyorhinis MCLD]
MKKISDILVNNFSFIKSIETQEIERLQLLKKKKK